MAKLRRPRRPRGPLAGTRSLSLEQWLDTAAPRHMAELDATIAASLDRGQWTVAQRLITLRTTVSLHVHRTRANRYNEVPESRILQVIRDVRNRTLNRKYLRGRAADIGGF